MSTAPEVKYTDRDVRESEELVERALEYVRNYTGEFQYLIDMKLRVAQEGDLTTPMIRGVLNCMRHDPRITDLPTPLPPQEGTVTELRPRRAERVPSQKRKRHGGRKSCHEVGVEHGYHYWTDDEDNTEYSCEGWHLINRGTVDVHGYRSTAVFTETVVKRPYAAARGGMLVHLINSAEVRWFAPAHEWGYHGDPDLVVRNVCRFPRFIERPLLLNQEQADYITGVGGRKYCPHCFDVMEALQ